MPVRSTLFAALALVATTALAPAAFAQDHWTVQERWVRAHEGFLAGEALQGRGRATPAEANAAALVAAQFDGLRLGIGTRAGWERVWTLALIPVVARTI